MRIVLKTQTDEKIMYEFPMTSRFFRQPSDNVNGRGLLRYNLWNTARAIPACLNTQSWSLRRIFSVLQLGASSSTNEEDRQDDRDDGNHNNNRENDRCQVPDPRHPAKEIPENKAGNRQHMAPMRTNMETGDSSYGRSRQ